MSERRKRMVLTLATIAMLAAVAGLAGAHPQAGPAAPAQPGQAAPTPKTAEQAFKNIQVLKGIPADQLIPAMQFIANSLGVQCEYCHVEHAFDKDDKLPKKTARKMMTMMFAINHDNFKDQRVVSCYSCHHGSKAPVAIPIIAEGEPKPEPEKPGMPGAPGATPAALPALPPANQLVEKYVAALGGADALEKVTSRVEKGTLSGFGGHQFPIEVYSKAPDKRLSLMHLPNGQSVTAYDGHVGWLGGGDRPPREVTGGELEAMKLDADFYFPTRIKQTFSKLRSARPEKIGDAETYVVLGIRPGQPPVKLYFDEQSGLLVRMVEYVDTPVGRNPTQIDYADYRDSGGVKVPFRWTIARPLGCFTIQVDQMEPNAAIDDTKFAMPAAPAGPPPGHP
jgi:photosynthetic reaction center cytochrome c subunit